MKPDITYIRPDPPSFDPPKYGGQSYEATIPATLDIAERARLAVNALTETTDPDYDYEIYWIIDLLAEEPAMYHSIDDHVQFKFMQALPLVRNISGSEQNLDVEAHLLMTYLKMQGPDGLVYLPIKGRPWALPPKMEPFAGLDFMPTGEHWCSICMNGRLLGAFVAYAIKDTGGPWREAAMNLADGLIRLCIVEDDIAYLFKNCTVPGMEVTKPDEKPTGIRTIMAGWVAEGLAKAARFLGHKEAGEMAARLMRYVMRDSGYFKPNGEFAQELPGIAHFHAHTTQILSTLEVVQATGDEELFELAIRAYEYAIPHGEPLVGFFPEWIGNRAGSTSEICEVADMIAIALKLTSMGRDEWDNVDRWIRNQFAECQLTSTNWITDGHREKIDRNKTGHPAAGCGDTSWGTTDNVAKRSIGSFAGWPSPNDLVEGTGWSIMHCCTGNGARTLHYIWEKILTQQDGALRVNLLLNRASRWADIDSHIPYQGRVDIHVKGELELEIRLPEWVEPEETGCRVNGTDRDLGFDGRYAIIGKVARGDKVELNFPIPERTDRVTIWNKEYTLIRRGNNVVWIDPPGQNCPLYQGGHYRTGQTLYRKAIRFVPDREITWS